MPARRRKKPPDPHTFPLQDFSCLPHDPLSAIQSSSLSQLPQIVVLGPIFRLVSGSLRNLAPPTVGGVVAPGAWPCRSRSKAWAAIRVRSGLSHSRTTDSYGKGVLGACFPS